MNVGSQVLTINPNVDLWLAAFATADETSGEHLLTNRVKGQKQFELTFGFEGDEKPSIEHLAVCVLARKKQSGRVSLFVVLNDGQQLRRTAEISEQSGNVFFSWVAPPGTSIKKLAIDGSEFSGDYVLLDDFGFILSGVPQTLPTQELPQKDDVPQQPLSDAAANGKNAAGSSAVA